MWLPSLLLVSIVATTRAGASGRFCGFVAIEHLCTRGRSTLRGVLKVVGRLRLGPFERYFAGGPHELHSGHEVAHQMVEEATKATRDTVRQDTIPHLTKRACDVVGTKRELGPRCG